MYLLGRRIIWRMYIHWLPLLLAGLWILQTVDTLTGPHVCSEKQKYNVTKRIKYRAPMAVRTYEWCLAVPPRCSRWTTEMRDLTKLETEERTMEVSVCCPGFTMKSASCHAKCPSGKTGNNCTEQCSKRKWGPSCSMDCVECPEHSSCSPYTGNCVCSDGWKGERCEKSTEEPTTVETVSITIPTTSIITTTMITQTTSQSTLLPTVPITESTKSSISSTRSFSNPLTTETTTIAMTTQKPITTAKAANVETTRQQLPVSQNTDKTTNNNIYFNNDTKMHKHELEMSITEPPTQNTIMWTITETPINITTTTTKLTSEYRLPSTIKTTLKDITTQSQFKITTTTTPPTTTKFPPTTTENATKLMKPFSTVPNVKPKEIWIKPTQKGDSVLIDPKHENSAVTDFHKHKYSTKTHPITDSTTLRTIIVSIIPTSIDHTAVFKKITIASSEHRPSKKVYIPNNTTKPSLKKIIATTSPRITILNRATSLPNTVNPLLIRNISKYLNEISTSKKPKVSTLPNSTISPIASYLYTNSLNFTKSASNNKYVSSTKSRSSNTANARNVSINNTNSNPSAGVPSSTSRSFTEITRVTPTSKKNISSRYFTKIIKFNPSIATRIYLLTTPTALQPFSKNITSTPLKSNSTVPVPVNRLLTTLLTTRRPVPSTLTSTGPNLTTTKFNDSSIVKNTIIIERNETATSKFTPAEDPTTSKPSILKLAVKADDTIGKKEAKDDTEAVPKLTNTNHNLATNQALTNTITPNGDEVFNVLTEPEHITAVAEGTERNTDNLLSILSIVVSVMFIVIAVAVVIVMMERCRRSRYEDVVKFDNLRMEATGGDEHFPPYVRSIFHTPLPEPPVTEKSHYQPISTLDRNLKQFMRPVVVHSISPVMMENFRGILECHYDHLPARNSHISFRSDTLSSQFRCSTTPSIESPSQRCTQRSPTSTKKLPVTDLSVEKLKHEGKVEIIDSTTTEPLYAEIPCWRLVSEHAIEIVNLNGEAVTEL